MHDTTSKDTSDVTLRWSSANIPTCGPRILLQIRLYYTDGISESKHKTFKLAIAIIITNCHIGIGILLRIFRYHCQHAFPETWAFPEQTARNLINLEQVALIKPSDLSSFSRDITWYIYIYIYYIGVCRSYIIYFIICVRKYIYNVALEHWLRWLLLAGLKGQVWLESGWNPNSFFNFGCACTILSAPK